MAAFAKPATFEEIDHTADWAYRVAGSSLAALFLAAAQGLYYLAGLELAEEPRITREIRLEGVDAESLLVAWLNELLYLHECENLGFDQLEILSLDAQSLQAQVAGAPVTQWVKDIKAVTYHNLAICSTEAGFEVTLVIDV
jgi:SHS2 domain-containing protein